ncbi:MAG: hypothetical protein MUC39_03410 [Candidatus Omnitrophica bacterium]|nr:hypothetical protein [Candidatus Omnitrophota bacterium]
MNIKEIKEMLSLMEENGLVELEIGNQRNVEPDGRKRACGIGNRKRRYAH